MEELFTASNFTALLALSGLEIVLGIDNIVMIAILVQRLPKEQQRKAQLIGLGLAMGFRILLLLTIRWIMFLTEPLFSIAGKDFSGKDLILFAGGLFLIWKATKEIHKEVAHETDTEAAKRADKRASFASVISTIVLVDLVFSLDSVITAVGMSNSIPVMITAVVIAVIVMMIFTESVSNFIAKHPTFKMLALSFLNLIGVLLLSEAFGMHFDRGYVYFAMGFSFFVEVLNMRIRKRKTS